MSKFNMQNVVVWINNDVKGGYKFRFTDRAENYLKLQVENSIEMGWPKKDIILITNFPFEYMGVKAYEVTEICRWSAFVNKLVVINQMIKKGVINDNIWLHDADAYQLVPFDFPEECKGVGFTKHAPGRSKPQGGSVFYRKNCYDVIDVISEAILICKPTKEESFFPRFYEANGGAKSVKKFKIKIQAVKASLKIAKENKQVKKIKKLKKKLAIYRMHHDLGKKYFGKFADRFSWLNWTYCLFRQGQFARKYPKATKPIKVVHFHTEYPSTMNCFYYGKNAYNVVVVTDLLKKLLIKHKLVVEENE